MIRGLLCGMLALLVTASASAQRYSGPITLIIPVSAGSGVESSFRLLAAEASRRLGQPILPENRPGAGGRIGMDAIMAGRKDGSTIGIATFGTTVTLPISDPKLSMEPEKDYVPVILTSTTYIAAAANPQVKFRDVKGMIDYARANPGKLNVTGVTLGSTGHLAWAMLIQKFGIDVTMTHYKAITQAQTDALNGTVDMIFLAASAKPLIDAGKLVAIATTSPQRWSLFPNTPTFAESGVPELSFGGWYGVIVPAGTPPEMVAVLNQAFSAVIDVPETKARHVALGMEALGSTPAGFTQHIRSEQQRWGPLIRKLSLKFE